MQHESIARGEKELRRAVELDPECVEGWVNLGGARMHQWDFEGCVEANRRAVQCDPESVQAHYNQGLGHMYLKQPEEMVACFQRVVELDPKHAAGQYHLAVAYLELDRVQEAAMGMLRAKELGFSPSPDFIKALQRKLAAKSSPPEKEGAKSNPAQ
jgi:cytochrome c-type biogenesis protein CcmH/NrfG